MGRMTDHAQVSVAARDRVSLRVAGGRTEGSDEAFTATHPGVDGGVETNPVILVLAEIARALVDREREARATLRVVKDDAA